MAGCVASGHHIVKCGAVLGAVKASSLRSDAACRGASDLDRASAQLVTLHLCDGRQTSVLVFKHPPYLILVLRRM